VRRAAEELVEIPGQDSFLDVITNIVGILILLVLIVGIRTSRSVAAAARAEATAGAPDPIADQKSDNVEEAIKAAMAERDHVNELIRRTLDVHGAMMQRDQERNMLANFVAAGEQDIRNRRASLNEQQQRDFDLRRQLGEAQKKLDDLAREQVSMLAQESAVEVVENLPTPLAKTVTGDEIHLRLAGGKVAVVPIEKLHGEAKIQFERNVWRLRDNGGMDGSIGPIDGFRMRYRIHVTKVSLPTRSGIDEVHPVVEQQYEYLPESTHIGEPVDQAVTSNSNLLQALRRHSPANTTVTIWTFADSFNEFRQLKKALFDLGFAAAGRPLPPGEEISSSPSGTKSSAQ